MSGRKLILLLLLVFFLGCRSREEEADLYLDYRINGNNSSDSAMVLLQAKKGSALGRSVKLNKGTRFRIDGAEVPMALSPVTGPYYFRQYPVDELGSAHQIEFISPGGRQQRLSFSWQPFQLSSLPDTADRTGLELNFDGLEKAELLHFFLVDTVFTGKGLEFYDTVRGNRYQIPAGKMGQLTPGPVQMTLERNRITYFAGGALRSSYVINREFWLK